MGRDPDGYVLDPEWDVHAPPTTRYYNLTLTEAVGSPDGVLRTFLLLNNQFPGPLIRANTNDTLHITLHNHSPNSTSLHWHGQHQRGTPWMDGTVGITSCPVPPGASFTYVFTVARTAGTFWYHAHFSTTRIDGVFGPLVIHAPDEPAVSSDRVLMVHDYYHDLSAALLHAYLAPDNENAEPVPDGALINGRGRVDCRAVAPGRVCNESWGDGMQYVGVEMGGVHRLRFINVGAFAEFDIEIDNHEMTLIEADGTPLTPQPLHRLRINVAQRYSVLLRATCKDLNTTLLTPSTPHHLPPPPASTLIRLRTNVEIGAYALARGYFNASSWRPAHPPTLVAIADGLRSGNAGAFASAATDAAGAMSRAFDTARQLVVRVPAGTVVDLLIDNFDDGNHPLHLHGHVFWVLARGKGYYDVGGYGGGVGLEMENPLRRDTVTVEAYGWVLLRVVMDNVGVWALHCHIVWHAEAGMVMQFYVAGEEGEEQWEVPRQVREGCAVPERQRGGGIDDEVFMREWVDRV
ncbi:multicopper oxidase-domain-containing protein [Morchella snyderi]|nr:multicopper oxidase-domain-containing protein [Morchella snyderi]